MSKSDYRTDTLSSDLPDALEFLNSAGDEELRAFLRRLPIFAGNDGGPITIADLAYEMRLQPFVMDAWSRVGGNHGIPARLLQLNRVYKKAEAEMERWTGERRRLPRVIDVPSFIEVYAKVGYP
ncbi:hypothetical protein SLH49_00870 [Cognatiyoonia sp. IB215446]|uniref:hypothetical protein n=1 Tax=Cognatiyoonia sp. IB215446 TaxID=3097355 RepID=UPI002A11D216|nr:hypothetical protein [Cognatiyoonia sp. IB215446]MDX8346521.1 hypothetical protein [Cognatiyoonia sp. IB215446]